MYTLTMADWLDDLWDWLRSKNPLGGPPHPPTAASVHVAIKSPWNPTWSPTISPPPACTCNPYMSNAFGTPVEGIGIFGPKFSVTGSVNPSSSVQLSGYELGIMQIVFASSMVAVYQDASGNPAWQLTISESTLPIRDSEADTPDWTKAASSIELTAGKTVSFEDRPRNIVPWQTKDKKGTLVSSSGNDAYGTWLAVRQKSTNSYSALCWATWIIDWGCNYDFKSQKGTPTGQGTITGQGNDGPGPLTPISGGTIANKALTLNWTGPAGGY